MSRPTRLYIDGYPKKRTGTSRVEGLRTIGRKRKNKEFETTQRISAKQPRGPYNV